MSTTFYGPLVSISFHADLVCVVPKHFNWIYLFLYCVMEGQELCVLMIIVGNLFKSSLLIVALHMPHARSCRVCPKAELKCPKRENKHARHLVMFSDSIKRKFSRYIKSDEGHDAYTLCLIDDKLFTRRRAKVL